MAIRPFRFTLAKVAAEELQLLEAINQFFPNEIVPEQLHDTLSRRLATLLGEGVSLSLEGVEVTQFSTWVRTLSPTCLIGLIGLQPIKPKLLIEMDPHIAGVMIDRLLGKHLPAKGPSSDVPSIELHPPTETELGVLQYLLMHCLAEIHHASGRAERVHFRFERFHLRSEEVQSVEAATARCGIFSWRVTCGEAVGVVRLIFCEPFVAAALLEPLALSAEARGSERPSLTRFDWVRTTLWVEGGVSELTPEEVAGLEAGDVVLLDTSALTLTGRRPGGEVMLRIGPTRERGIRAHIVEGNRLGVQIVDIE